MENSDETTGTPKGEAAEGGYGDHYGPRVDMVDGSGNIGIAWAAVETVAVSGIGLIAATMFQETLQRAASDSYDGARGFFTSLRGRLRRSQTNTDVAQVELIVVQSEDGRWNLLLPGDLDEEAHAALIRDFDGLVRDAGDGRRFSIFWQDGKWIKQDA